MREGPTGHIREHDDEMVAEGLPLVYEGAV
jgi:hypothetical protein